MVKLFKLAQLGPQTHSSTKIVASQAVSHAPAAESGLPARLVSLFAVACGLLVANVYYSQPIAGPIASSLGLSPEATGIVVTATQAGFGLGLLFLVPLGDLAENRRLVLVLIGLAAALLMAALSDRLSTWPVWSLGQSSSISA